MNHYDFMERKSRRRQLDILDYVKNTGRPKNTEVEDVEEEVDQVVVPVVICLK